MTSSQVLELDLSEVQFEELSDEMVTSTKEILSQKLFGDDTPLSVFGNDDDDGDDDLPRFYEVEEPLEIEPDDMDLLTGTGSVVPSGGTDFGNLSDPNLSDYWAIEFDEAGTVTVQVLREEADFDPALWIVEGVVNDPASQFGSEIDFGDPGVVAFADDELPPATGVGTGPFGDPSINITGVEDEIFTLIVTNFLSGPDTGGDGSFDYTLTIS